MSPRRLFVVLVAAAAALACASCGGGDEPLPRQRLAIASGSQGGVYFRYGDGLARVVRRHLPALAARAVSTSGSVDSLRRLRDGSVEVAFTRADSVENELRGKPSGIVALARLYDSYVQIVVRADSRIRTLDDLRDCGGRDCRVATGQTGSGTQLLAARVLQAAGLAAPGAVRRVDRYDIKAAMDALVERRVDAVFWAGGLPTPSIQAADERIGVAFVDLGEVAVRLHEDHPNLYTQKRLPRGEYDSPASAGTVSVANYLVARDDLDERTAYALTQMLFARRAELVARGHSEARFLDSAGANDVYPLRLHPGAERYYGDTRG